MKEKIKDIAIRAGKTFWQSALATLVVAMPEIIELSTAGWDVMRPILISACIGALAAGLSAVYNGFIAPMLKVDANKKAVLLEADKAVEEVEKNGGENSVDEGK